MVYNALNRAFAFEIVFISIFAVVTIGVFCIAKHSDRMCAYAIGLLIALLLKIVVTVPFFKDYFGKNIIETSGVYVNINKSNSPSSRLGMHSVLLQTADETIKLVTVPLSKFPKEGKYYVKAYYTANSKQLVYIEIIEGIEE